MINTTINYHTSQQNIIDQYKTAFPGSYTKKDLVSTEQSISVVDELDKRIVRLFELLLAMSLNGRSLYMSHEWLARKLSCSVRWVIDMLQKLQAMGIVSWVSGKGNYTTNIYFVHLSLLTHEAVRRLQSKFVCARQAWYRRLIRFSSEKGMLETPHSEREFIPRYSKLYLKTKRNITNTNVEVIRDSYVVKKTGSTMIEERKMVFEALSKKGFTFSLAAQVELGLFNDACLLASAARYAVSSKKASISNPWSYFVGIAYKVATELNHNLDRVYASTLRSKFNVKETDKRTLEYTPSMSDNNREDSTKKESDSGKLTNNTPDADGWVYGVMKDGTKVRSRPYQHDFRKHARNPIDLPLVEIPHPKREYGNPGETPQTIRMNMMNYAQSQIYQDNCIRYGKENTDAQINLWLKVANLEEAGNFERAEEIRGQLYGEIMLKLAKI